MVNRIEHQFDVYRFWVELRYLDEKLSIVTTSAEMAIEDAREIFKARIEAEADGGYNSVDIHDFEVVSVVQEEKVDVFSCGSLHQRDVLMFGIPDGEK